MPRRRPASHVWLAAGQEEWRVADDQIVAPALRGAGAASALQPRPSLQAGLVHAELGRPGARPRVHQRDADGASINVYGVHAGGVASALRCHDGQHAGARPHVQHGCRAARVRPGAQQHGVGAHLVGGAPLVQVKVSEAEHGRSWAQRAAARREWAARCIAAGAITPGARRGPQLGGGAVNQLTGSQLHARLVRARAAGWREPRTARSNPGREANRVRDGAPTLAPRSWMSSSLAARLGRASGAIRTWRVATGGRPGASPVPPRPLSAT
jgi:hypothetical protein